MPGVASNTAFHVPQEVADALRAEAYRTLRRPGEVLVDFVRTCWPDFIAGRLRTELRHPATVIDVVAVETVRPVAELEPVP